MSSPSNYMEKYIKNIKDKTRGNIVQTFDSIEINDETRNRIVESTNYLILEIESRIVGSISMQKESSKGGKHERDTLLSSFDLQKKLRDALLKKVLEVQDIKKDK
jgi:hypothetical protein